MAILQRAAHCQQKRDSISAVLQSWKVTNLHGTDQPGGTRKSL